MPIVYPNNPLKSNAKQQPAAVDGDRLIQFSLLNTSELSHFLGG
jgi:hypothetical protein